MTTKEIARSAAQVLDAKKGMAIRLLEVTDVTTLAEYFLICTGTSNTHIRTLCDAVEEAMEGFGETLHSREGHRGGAWVLLDFGAVVVHVFTEEARSFYDLERLWNDATPISIEEENK